VSAFSNYLENKILLHVLSNTAYTSPTTVSASNTSAIEFPTATASWGTVGWVAVWDNLSGGNLLFHGALTASKTIASGDVFRIPAGDLDITLD